MIHIGVIGFGTMGQIRARTLGALDGCEISAVYDVQLPDDVPYPVAKDAQSIIDDPKIDAVVVCVPNYMIKPLIVDALAAGKDVFSEKPPAMNGAEMEEIRDARDASGKVLMYGFNHRRHEAVIKMKELVDGGSLGKVLWMRGRYGKSVDAAYLRGWRADKSKAGGGILLDQGIHMLDLFLHIGGQPFDEVQAMVSNLYWQQNGIEDNVFAMMRNSESGMCAQLHSTMTQWRHLFSLEVFLERGYMVLNGLKTGSGSYGEEALMVARNRSKAPAATWEDEERFVYEIDTSWTHEAKGFYDALTGKGQTHGTVRHALELMRLIDRIYENDTHVAPSLHGDLQGSDKA